MMLLPLHHPLGPLGKAAWVLQKEEWGATAIPHTLGAALLLRELVSCWDTVCNGMKGI